MSTYFTVCAGESTGQTLKGDTVLPNQKGRFWFAETQKKFVSQTK